MSILRRYLARAKAKADIIDPPFIGEDGIPHNKCKEQIACPGGTCVQ